MRKGDRLKKKVLGSVGRVKLSKFEKWVNGKNESETEELKNAVKEWKANL